MFHVAKPLNDFSRTFRKYAALRFLPMELWNWLAWSINAWNRTRLVELMALYSTECGCSSKWNQRRCLWWNVMADRFNHLIIYYQYVQRICFFTYFSIETLVVKCTPSSIHRVLRYSVCVVIVIPATAGPSRFQNKPVPNRKSMEFFGKPTHFNHYSFLDWNVHAFGYSLKGHRHLL